MKRKCLLTLLVAAAAAAAHGEPAASHVAVSASVDRMCILTSPQVNLGQSTNVSQVSGSTITIAELSDENMTAKATDIFVSLAGMCNFSHQLTVTSDRGGLWRTPPGLPAAGFASGVPYRATINWAGRETTLQANAVSEGAVQQTLPIDLPGGGDVQLRLHIDQSAANTGSGTPLVAGIYMDTIRLTLGPL